MALATPADVGVQMMRDLSDQETALALALLDTVERRLARRVSDLLTNADKAATVIDVEAAAVARVLKNADGFRSESDGDYNFTRDVRVASGFLLILDEEWLDLGVGGSGAYSIDLLADWTAP